MNRKEFEFYLVVALIVKESESLTINGHDLLVTCEKYAYLCGYPAEKILPYVKAFSQKCNVSSAIKNLTFLIKDFTTGKLIAFIQMINQISEDDFNAFISTDRRTIEIRGLELISPFEIEDLSRIYNLDLNRKRREPKILRKYGLLGNILIVVAYLRYKNSVFKRGYLITIAMELNKIVSISVATLKVKVRQLKIFVERSNMEDALCEAMETYPIFNKIPEEELALILSKHDICYDSTFPKKLEKFKDNQQSKMIEQISKGLVDVYFKFKDIPLEKLNMILNEYEVYTDENLEKRFMKLLNDSSYLDEKIEKLKNTMESKND